jgi:hypothetical protein
MKFAHALCLTLFTISVSVLPCYARASEPADLTVTPVIISEKAKVRDIIKESITIKNTSEHTINLYPSVYDVSAIEGETGFERAGDSLERSVSLANWIELSRGVVELGPGEEKTLPFVVRVNLNAEPGTYYAHISFGEGPTRDEAEAIEPLAQVSVNIEVLADIKEVLQLGTFFTDSFFLSGDDVLFNYQIENIGNQDLKPSGEIRIYDRTGTEVASVPVNADGATFSPEQEAMLAAVWNGAQGFGKYKAFLNIDYGSNQRASVQDTVFFWIVPWKQLASFFTVGVLLVIFFVYYYHLRLERRYALQHGGALPHPTFTVHEDALKPKKNRGGWFGLFGFGTPRRTPVPEHSVQALHTERVVHPSPEPVMHRTEIHVQKPQAHTMSSGTINLKDLRRPTQQAETHEVHVINLKK